MLLTRSAPTLILGSLLYLCAGSVARAQEPAAPPAYLAVVVRLRVVSTRGSRVAAVLLRRLVNGRAVRLDVGGPRRVVVADASLWALGPRAKRVVLDSRPYVERRVGIMGAHQRLRELVSAR